MKRPYHQILVNDLFVIYDEIYEVVSVELGGVSKNDINLIQIRHLGVDDQSFFVPESFLIHFAKHSNRHYHRQDSCK